MMSFCFISKEGNCINDNIIVVRIPFEVFLLLVTIIEILGAHLQLLIFQVSMIFFLWNIAKIKVSWERKNSKASK